MTINNSDISTFTIERMMGTISEQDDALLQEAITSDPEARLIYNEVVRQMQDPENIERSKTWDADELVAALVKRKGSARRVRVYAAIVAAASVLIFAGIYFLGSQTRTPVVAKLSGDIVFTGSDGKAIVIDSAFKWAVVGNVTVTVSGNVLHYSVPGGAEGQRNSLQVPVGKDYTIELSDHSLVHLNAASSISFPTQFSALPGSKREITIDGEAFLDVAHDSEHPFVVHLPKGDVQVLGTSFNVNSYSAENTEVSLVSGAVRMTRDSSVVLLKPGQQAIASQKGIMTRPFDAATVLAWQDGKYIFRDARVTEIEDVVRRYYGLQVDASKLNAGDYLFTDTLYKSAAAADFLYELSQALQVQYKMDGARVVLYK